MAALEPDADLAVFGSGKRRGQHNVRAQLRGQNEFEVVGRQFRFAGTVGKDGAQALQIIGRLVRRREQFFFAVRKQRFQIGNLRVGGMRARDFGADPRAGRALQLAKERVDVHFQPRLGQQAHL